MSYASEVLADGAVLQHRYQEASGQPQDSSGNGLHSTAIGGTPLYQQPSPITNDPVDFSLTFDEAGGYPVNDNALLDFGDVFTLECWAKRTRSATFEVLVTKGQDGYWFYFFSDDKLSLGKVAVATIVQSTGTITDTAWHHCVATKNGATSKIYLDGVDVTGTPSNQTISNTAIALNIGREVDVSNPFLGSIDELALYPTALSQTRVQAHYNAATQASGVSLRSQHLDYDYSR